MNIFKCYITGITNTKRGSCFWQQPKPIEIDYVEEKVRLRQD